MNLFIDTNVFLHIYHYSGDDLTELDKLSVLIRNSDLKLFLPEQVYNEFYRNRDNTLADTLKEFRKDKLDKQFPQVTKHYEEYKKMREAIKLYEESKQSMLNKLQNDIVTDNLKADKVINSLFSNAIVVHLDDEIFQKAKQRFDLGNPPGKNESYGDAINWESLLKATPDLEPLVFISDDGDYYSKVDDSLFNPYLFKEWQKIKHSNIIHFRNLTVFFRENFPQIKLADELEKNLLIERLATSGSFTTTHLVLSKLSSFNDFTREQINDIILACVSNNQIYWIATDQDIKDNLSKIVLKHSELIDPDLFNQFIEIYNDQDDGIEIENG